MAKIELKVELHPSGRYTLKHRGLDEEFTDYPPGSPFFGNPDKGKFYRAVAQEINSLNIQGNEVEYTDVL